MTTRPFEAALVMIMMIPYHRMRLRREVIWAV